MRQSPSNPSTVRAGGAYVELTLRDKVSTGMHAVERKLARFSARMNNVANRMLATGAMFATPFIAATVAYAGFEKQMAEVSTMLDKPERHMQRFSDAVLDMSREFGDSTESVARGLYDILSAAIAPADALAVLSVSAKAAVGGLTDTATAVDAITTILNSFGMEASEANDVADVLFTTVKRGKLQFNDLAQFIGKTTSFAALAGIELAELGAMLATTTRAGLQPEIAVTATRQFIGSIIRPTKESAKLFAKIFGKEMNTRILKTWGGVLGFLKRISKLDTETQAKLFPNVRAAAAALTLTANTEGFEQDLGYMMNRAGAAEEAFDKMSKTTAFAWNKLKQSVVSVFTTIGEAIGPMVSNAAQAIGVVVESILPWIKANGALFVSLAGIVASILGLGAALKVAAFAITGFSIVLKTLMITMSVFTAAWVTLKAIILGTMAVFTGFNAITIAGLAATLTLVVGLISVFGEGLANSFKKAKHDAGQMVEGITAALQTGNIKLAAEILSAGVELVFTEMMKGIKNAWSKWTNDLAKTLVDTWTWLQKKWSNAKMTWGMLVPEDKLRRDLRRRVEQAKRDSDAERERRESEPGYIAPEKRPGYKKMMEEHAQAQQRYLELDQQLDELRNRGKGIHHKKFRAIVKEMHDLELRHAGLKTAAEEESANAMLALQEESLQKYGELHGVALTEAERKNLEEWGPLDLSHQESVAHYFNQQKAEIEGFGKQVTDELTRQLDAELSSREEAIEKKREQLKQLTGQAKAEWEEYKAEKAEEERLAALALPEIDDNKKIEAAIAGVRGALNYAAAIRLGLEAGTNAFENLEERNTKANEKAAETLSGVKQLLETMTGDL